MPTASAAADPIVWQPRPEQVASTALAGFMRAHRIPDYDALVRRSNAEPEWYWDAVIRRFAISFFKPYEKIMDANKGAPWTEWCVGGEMNMSESCLDRHRGTATMSKEAVIWESEDGRTRSWTYAELIDETGRLAAGLSALGFGRGDAIGIFLPMLPETVAAFFAIARIGAIAVPLFSGFGPDAIASRLTDAGAVACITCDGTRRRGATVPMKATLDLAAATIPTLRRVIVLPSLGIDIPWQDGRDVKWSALTDGKIPAAAVAMPADAPMMVIFTSGTTGRAKGTVHTHCGFLTKLAADFGLVLDFRADDRMLWMSDLGWLVGPMQIVVATFFGATLVLAEGAPDWPIPGRLWRTVDKRRVTYLGVAPTTARAMMGHGEGALAGHDLSSLRMTVASGELWNPDSWNWFFDRICGRRIPILNTSGGTEIGWGIVSCTAIHPMKPCAFSGPMPGMGADIVDGAGRSVSPGETGELVLRIPSIGLSRGLWGDPEKYLDTYWRKIPGMWVHGDWASRDEDGFWHLHGRSDDTIKVAGKRCGPLEVESILVGTGTVAEAAVTGVADPLKGEAVLCVCVPNGRAAPNADLARALADAVAKELSPAFRPREVLFVKELPKTRSLKIMRRVVRALYEGRDPGDLASLVNPPAVAELKSVVMASRNRP